MVMARQDLALFHGEIDGAATLVAEDDVELGADGFLEQPGKIKAGARGAAGTTFGRLRGFAHVFDGFVGAVRAHVEMVLALRGGADEAVFGPVVFYFLAADELIEIERRRDPAESQAVGLRNRVNIVRRDHRARARHVLHDAIRIAGNVFAHVLGDQPWPEIVDVTRGITGDDANGLALVVRRLGFRDRSAEKKPRQNEKEFLHICLQFFGCTHITNYKGSRGVNARQILLFHATHVNHAFVINRRCFNSPLTAERCFGYRLCAKGNCQRSYRSIPPNPQ
jgi:hypothetical protein